MDTSALVAIWRIRAVVRASPFDDVPPLGAVDGLRGEMFDANSHREMQAVPCDHVPPVTRER